MAVLPDVPARHVALPDGRMLAYSEHGPADGRPIMFFHGTPGSRHTARYVMGPHQGLLGDVRLIAVDRPGCGESDHDPRRTTRSFALDVGHLADALGITRFSILAISGGGAHAVACAALLHERLDGVAILSGMACTTAGASRAGLGGFMRLMLALGQRAPGLLRALMRAQGGLMVRGLRDPAKALARAKRMKGPEQADMVGMLGDPADFPALRADMQAAFAQRGLGPARDMVVFGRPYDVDVGQADVEVHLWHGELDPYLALGKRNADLLPRCTACFGSYGHFGAMRMVPEALAALEPPASQTQTTEDPMSQVADDLEPLIEFEHCEGGVCRVTIPAIGVSAEGEDPVATQLQLTEQVMADPALVGKMTAVMVDAIGMETDDQAFWDERTALLQSLPEVTPDTLDAFVAEHPLVALEVWGSQCSICMLMAPAVHRVADRFAGAIAVAQVNGTEHPELREALRVHGFPTIILYRDGAIVGRLIGARGEKALRRELEDFAGSAVGRLEPLA